jgi:ribosomal protein L11 methyltransferase
MSEARYPYVHVDVAADDVELISSELFELGALGIEERDATTLLREAGSQPTTLVASFDDEASAQAAQAQLAPRHPARVEYVVGDEWREAWRSYFKPARVGERLWVRPSWEAFEAPAGEQVIILDPGQAFGTGTHESTRLVLGALGPLVRSGARVLDIGTGSGILAIASLLLGAAEAVGVDVDPLALAAAAENAAANGVADRLHVSPLGIEELSERYDLVLANIEARVLVQLAAAIAARVAPGGRLILSGLLTPQADEVRAAYREFRERERPIMDEWCALVLERGGRGAGAAQGGGAPRRGEG